MAGPFFESGRHMNVLGVPSDKASVPLSMDHWSHGLWLSGLAHQLRQLRDVGGDPPRLVARVSSLAAERRPVTKPEF